MDQDETWHGGRPWSRSHCVRWGPSSPPKAVQTLPNFRPMSIVAKWLVGSRCHLVRRLGLDQGDIVLDGDPSPQKWRTAAPHFSAHVLWPNSWMDQDGTWHRGLGHIVLDGDRAPFPKKGGRDPQFSAHFYCVQTAGCINMPIGLSPGDFVFDGDPSSMQLSPEKRAHPPHPIFGPCLSWPHTATDQSETCE